MRRTIFPAICLVGALLLLPDLRATLAGDAAPLCLSTFQSDVTLPLGDLLYAEPLKTVEHPLLAKGVVLDDGGKRYVLCAVDWCTMRNAAHATFQTKIAEAAGAEPSHVAVQCVHQHTAPSFDASAERLLQQQENPPQLSAPAKTHPC